MVKPRPFFSLILVLVAFFLPMVLSGQGILSAKVEAYYAIISAGAGNWASSAAASGAVDYVYSTPVVKAEIDTTMTVNGDATVFLLDAAYAKLKFGESQLTVGLTGLGWGIGTVFNAADLIVADETLLFDLGADSFRPERDMLIAFFCPFDDFIFIEAVGLPAITTNPSSPIAPTQGKAGIRFQGKWDSWVAEISYLTDGEADLHKVGVSFQGHLWADFYAGARMDIPFAVPAQPDFGQWLTATAGIFNMHDLNDDYSLTWRIEALYDVDGEWIEQDNPLTAYALILYPEISLNAFDQTTIFVRGLFNPIDVSARTMVGASWSPAGFWSLFAQASYETGETTDLFCIDRPYGISFAAGLEMKW